MSKKEMTQEREAKILEGAIDRWGARRQILKAVEEMGELTVALMKHMNADMLREGGLASIREEMADVGIMLNQLCLIFGEPIDKEIEKLERLEERIWDDKEEA